MSFTNSLFFHFSKKVLAVFSMVSIFCENDENNFYNKLSCMMSS